MEPIYFSYDKVWLSAKVSWVEVSGKLIHRTPFTIWSSHRWQKRGSTSRRGWATLHYSESPFTVVICQNFLIWREQNHFENHMHIKPMLTRHRLDLTRIFQAVVSQIASSECNVLQMSTNDIGFLCNVIQLSYHMQSSIIASQQNAQKIKKKKIVFIHCCIWCICTAKWRKRKTEEGTTNSVALPCGTKVLIGAASIDLMANMALEITRPPRQENGRLSTFSDGVPQLKMWKTHWGIFMKNQNDCLLLDNLNVWKLRTCDD